MWVLQCTNFSGKEWRKGTKRNAANECLAALLIAVALDERGAVVVDFLLPELFSNSAAPQ